jgi:hypothetical protein
MKFALFLALALPAAAAAMPEGYAERLADAIWLAEGGKAAKTPYGVLSVRTGSEARARAVCVNTVRNNWTRWEAAGKPGDFIDYLGKKYAPVGAKNDPRGLNKNWPGNVRRLLK